jgi:uncharacterized protein (DUF1499 family)
MEPLSGKEDNRRSIMEAENERKKRALSTFAVGGFILALLAGLAEIAAGWGTRWGFWDYRGGFFILRFAAYAGIACGVLSLIGCAITWPGSSRRGILWAAAGLLIALIVVFIPWSAGQRAHQVPAIHDITTDPENPPRFVALLAVRNASANKSEYGGPEIAAKQRAAYPDIAPLELAVPPGRAYTLAVDAARALGWEIADAVEKEGRIEATDTTFWFGFKDDIVIRISPTPGGSRVDVRSVSRVGRSDLGTNAKRVRGYLQKIRELTNNPAAA